MSLLVGSAEAAGSGVTLSSTSPSVKRGDQVGLLGSVPQAVSPCGQEPGSCVVLVPEVVILARHDRAHRFGRVAIVYPGDYSTWQLTLRPLRSTTYLAVSDGLRSRPLRIHVVR